MNIFFKQFPRYWIQQVCQVIGTSAFLLACASGTVVLPAQKVNAAETLVFNLGPLGESVTIKELQTFVDDGTVPRAFRPYLRLTKTDPEVVRTLLSQEANVSLKFLDRTLNTLPGEYLLFRLGKIVHTPSRSDNIQALRSALVLASANDNRISLLEFLEKYPTQQVTVDGVALIKAINKFNKLKGKVQVISDEVDAWIAVAKDLLDDFICDCQQ